jgi:WD40 repeat protein/uncharacterized caspase-like protein
MKCLLALLFSSFFILNSNAQTPDLVLPIGHTKIARFVTYSPDGKLMATNTGEENDHTIHIWEAATGKLLQTKIGFSYTPRGMQFMKDGKHLFLHDNFMTVVDIQSKRQVHFFDTLPAEHIAISPDEKWLAFQPRLGSRYLDSICVFSMQTGKLASMFYCEGFDISDLVFTPDAKEIITFTPYPDFATNKETDKDTSFIIRWDVRTGKKIWTAKVEQEPYGKLQLSKDGRYLFDMSNLYLLNAQTGEPIEIEVTNSDMRLPKAFAPSLNLIAIQKDSTIDLINTNSLKVVHQIPKPEMDNNLTFSSNDELLFIEPYTNDTTIHIEAWNVKSGKKIIDYQPVRNDATLTIEQIVESPDGKTVAIPDRSGKISLLRKDNLKEYAALKGYTNDIKDIRISRDSSRLFITDKESHFKITEVRTGKVVQSIKLIANGELAKYCLTSDEKKIVAIGFDTTLAVWDISTGTKLFQLKGDEYNFYNAAIHPSDQFFVTWEAIGNKLKFIDLLTGKVKTVLNIPSKEIDFDNLSFSKDGKFLFGNFANAVQVRDGFTGKLIKSLTGSKNKIETFKISEDGKLMAVGADSLGFVWEIATGKRISTFKTKWPNYINADLLPNINFLKFSADNKQILTGCYIDGAAKVYDTYSGKLLHLLDSVTNSPIVDGWFLENENVIATRERDNLLYFWDKISGKLIKSVGTKGEGGLYAAAISGKKLFMAYGSRMFTFNDWKKFSIHQSVFINQKDWLVIDSANRYDGTEAARKFLYFVCDNEPIDLEQVKDQLWVPGLAERLYIGETINTKGISELNICELTPIIEEVSKDKSAYQFNIIPRNGGLGDVVVQVNGIEVKRYNPSQLKPEGNSFTLQIPTTELKDFFIAGQENRITAKALTADNTISSRGFGIDEEDTTAATPPNLYAVIVGVSDYKGDEMDLKFAAKDANDMTAALGNASRKLLNTDGKEHVFTYNFTTDKQRYQLPEKAAIKKVMEEIGAKTQPNDILVLFFAGHGVMAGADNNKQFYFLTAEASALSATENISNTGISTTELTEWMKPQNIKAQKRILVFDACNSGQAIKDFVKIGNNDQNYLAARDDAKAQQVKAIDKLNEKSGLFILSASASNQSAYEMGRYSQGLLTYSLLKAIKQQPEILNNGKYLDLSKWFNAAKESVVELSKESGARQEPQIVTNTNFNVGVVDDEVIAKIIMPSEKPLFAASNFQNSDEAIADDDLELNRLINLQLIDMATRGNDSKIIYVTATNSPEAYSLSGRYKVMGKIVTVYVNVKQGKTVKQKLEVKGSADNLNELAAEVVKKATAIIN